MLFKLSWFMSKNNDGNPLAHYCFDEKKIPMSSFQDRFLPKIFQNQILKIKTSHHSISKDNKVSFEKIHLQTKMLLILHPRTWNSITGIAISAVGAEQQNPFPRVALLRNRMHVHGQWPSTTKKFCNWLENIIPKRRWFVSELSKFF